MADIHLKWELNGLSVYPWPACLERPLTVRRKIRDQDVLREIPEELFSVDKLENGIEAGFTHAGLLWTVWEILQAAGHRIVFHDLQGVPPAPAPLPEHINLRPGQKEALKAISEAVTGGILWLPTAYGKSFVLELLPKLYPDLKLLITTCKGDLLNQLWDRLTTANPDRYMCMVKAGKKFLPDSDVILASARSLHRIPADWPDLVLFDEVHRAASPEVAEQLVRFEKARMFGMSASPFGRSDGTDLLTTALFGPVLCKLEYDEAVRDGVVARIRVWMLETDGPDVGQMEDWKKIRVGIIENCVRNRDIADAARLFAADVPVLIMVSAVEHAARLRELLPEFDLAYGHMTDKCRRNLERDGINTSDLPADMDTGHLLEDFRNGARNKVISTTKWQEGVDIPRLCVFIKADGRGGKIPAYQGGGRLSRKKNTSAILVDFNDRNGLEWKTSSRRQLYKQQGWEVYDTNLAAIRKRLRAEGRTEISF